MLSDILHCVISDSITENTARCTLDQENDMQHIVVKQEDLNTQVCIDVLEQNSGFKDIDLAVKLNSASSISSFTSNTGRICSVCALIL